MANPNLLSNTSTTLDILVEAQLSSGNNDFTVPTGKAWTVRSVAACNVSGSAVTLNVSVIKSGATARKVLHNLVVAVGDTVTVGSELIGVLPESATLRMNSSAASALDVVVTGVVAA